MQQLARDLFVESRRPMKAYTLLARLEERLGRQLSPPTVYRALRQLLAAGDIVRIESQAAFLPVEPLAASRPRVFLLCRACGMATEAADTSIADQLSQLAAAHAFAVCRSVIEIEGNCRQCAPGEAVGVGS